MVKPRGIFCIETSQWTARRRGQPSVVPLLRLIESIQGTPFIHRQFSTWEDLELLLGQATRASYRRYPIVYLACHGEMRRLALRGKGSKNHVGRAVTIAELAAPLHRRGAGKVILFSACSLMRGNDGELRRFVDDTGVRAIMGYERDVGWIESAQLELGLLASLARSRIADGKSLRAALADLKSARDLMRDLEFRIVPRRAR